MNNQNQNWILQKGTKKKNILQIKFNLFLELIFCAMKFY